MLNHDSSCDETVAIPSGDNSGIDLDLDVTDAAVPPHDPAVAYTRTHGGQPPEAPTGNHIALPKGFALDEYTIVSVLGAGGFGITYLAYDNNLQCQVAIKEYLPGDLAVRTGGRTVVPRSDKEHRGYQDGLLRFLAETRVLASFRHPNIVRVSRFFEANNTAYMVMDYEHGRSLRDWLANHGPADETVLRRMFLPLLDGIAAVHGGGIVHRDIKPGNIYVRDSDASLVLLDFGSARQSTGTATRSLTSIVTPGYAPFEQYHTRGAQGPWTDLYALGGVLYWLVTGQKPVEAPARIKEDCLIPAVKAAAGRYSADFLRAIDWSLAVEEAYRPQNVAMFRPVFKGDAAAPAVFVGAPLQPVSPHDELTVPVADAVPPGPTFSPPPPPPPLPETVRQPAAARLAIGAGAALLIAAAAFLVMPGLPSPADSLPKPEKPAQPKESPTASLPPPQEADRSGKAQAESERKRPTAPRPALPSPGNEPVAANLSPLPKKDPLIANPPSAGNKRSADAPGANSSAIPSATLLIEVEPEGEYGDILINGERVGAAPEMKKINLPAGKYKVEIRGNKLPYTHYHWVEIAPNEKKKIWAKFQNQ